MESRPGQSESTKGQLATPVSPAPLAPPLVAREPSLEFKQQGVHIKQWQRNEPPGAQYPGFSKGLPRRFERNHHMHLWARGILGASEETVQASLPSWGPSTQGSLSGIVPTIFPRNLLNSYKDEGSYMEAPEESRGSNGFVPINRSEERPPRSLDKSLGWSNYETRLIGDLNPNLLQCPMSRPAHCCYINQFGNSPFPDYCRNGHLGVNQHEVESLNPKFLTGDDSKSDSKNPQSVLYSCGSLKFDRLGELGRPFDDCPKDPCAPKQLPFESRKASKCDSSYSRGESHFKQEAADSGFEAQNLGLHEAFPADPFTAPRGPFGVLPLNGEEPESIPVVQVNLTKKNKFSGLFSLLSPLFLNEWGQLRDVREISNQSFTLFQQIIAKKSGVRLREKVDLLDPNTAEAILSSFNRSSVKRKEENGKFIYKSVLKYLMRVFEKQHGLPQDENKSFYNHYFGELAAQTGHVIESYWDPTSMRIPKPADENALMHRSINHSFFLHVFRAPQFKLEFFKFLGSGRFIQICREKVEKKLTKLMNKWFKELKKLNQDEKTFEAKIFDYFTEKKRCKLPWTIHEAQVARDHFIEQFGAEFLPAKREDT